MVIKLMYSAILGGSEELSVNAVASYQFFHGGRLASWFLVRQRTFAFDSRYDESGWYDSRSWLTVP